MKVRKITEMESPLRLEGICEGFRARVMGYMENIESETPSPEKVAEALRCVLMTTLQAQRLWAALYVDNRPDNAGVIIAFPSCSQARDSGN